MLYEVITCWCDPVKSDKTPDGEYKAAQLVRSNQALYEYCLAFGVPLIRNNFV